MSNKEVDYSVVVPIYNEVGNIRILDKEIREVMNKMAGVYEIIYINDGSTDGSTDELKKLKGSITINLNRNYGQATALDAGFKLSKGKIVISLDGDMQNDPKDIPRLVSKLKSSGLDAVAGWRKNRKDKRGIRILTNIGRSLRNLILRDPVHDTGCTLRAYKQDAIKSIELWGEMHRYILALLKWKGYKVGELEVNHRPRSYGNTKYGYNKAVRGFIDLIYIWFINKYSNRPLHMFGNLAILSFVFAFLSGTYSLYSKIFEGLSLNRNGWFFLSFFFLLASVMFFSFGITIDLLLRNYFHASPIEKRYQIKDVIVN